jgi:O-succinylbenzoate synthase
MDAGVVLRERRLKTRDGLFIRLQRRRARRLGEISLPGFSLETLDEAQAALLAWASAWRDGEEARCRRRLRRLLASAARWRSCAASCRRRGLSRGAALHRRSG